MNSTSSLSEESVRLLKPLETQRQRLLLFTATAWLYSAAVCYMTITAGQHPETSVFSPQHAMSAFFASLEGLFSWTWPTLLPTATDLLLYALWISAASSTVFAIRAIVAFRRQFRETVISHLLRCIAPGLCYTPRDHVAVSVFRQSGLYSYPIDSYEGHHLIHGSLGNLPCKISMLNVQYKTQTSTTNSEGRTETRTTWHTVFKGVFLWAELPKECRGAVLVLPKSAERPRGPAQISWRQMQLEFPQFSGEIKAYGTDEVESRVVLSPRMQERILQLRSRCGKRVRLSIIGSSLAVALPGLTLAFRPPLFRSAMNLRRVERWSQEVQFVLCVLDDLGVTATSPQHSAR